MSAQLPLFEPTSNWQAPSLSSLPADWGDGRVGIDCETRDEHLFTLGPGVRRGAYIVGVSIAFEDGGTFYLPIRHGGGGNLDPDQVIAYLRDCARKFTGTLVGANLQYDLDFLNAEGITFPNVKWFRDVQVADPLINELHYSYSMEAIAGRWNMPGKDESLLMEALAAYGYKGRKAKGGIWALHARHVGPYAEQDARLPLDILRRQEREIEDQDLWQIFNLESKVLPILSRMRQRGVAVSLPRLEHVENWARKQQQDAIDAANQTIKRRLDFSDITKTAVLAEVLREIGVDLPKTTTGKDSVTAAVLAGIDHPVAAHLRRAKAMSTLRSTFCDGVRAHLTNGRIHCTFNQLRRQKDDGSDTEGAAFGRLSSADPNLQNQPARDPEIGPLWRSIYVPDEGGVWASMDYSQQEPRHAVESALDAGPGLIGKEAYESAVEAARRYREDPTMDFHQMMADMAGIARKPAKNIFLGLSYGMGGAKLCRDLGLPTVWRVSWKEGRARRYRDYENRDEALAKFAAGRAAGYEVRYWEAAGQAGQDLTDTFDSKVPFVRKMADHMQKVAAKQGYILTILGRRCRFPEKDDGSYDWLHKAFNRRIQGSSADQTKQACIDLEEAGIPINIQVHDEICWSAPSVEAAQAAGRIMEQTIPMKVPMKVDVETGDSWGDSM